MAYIHSHYELDSRAELIRMQQRAKAYQVIGEELYKTSITGPFLHRYMQAHAVVTLGQGPSL
jgi:hypothetical protein